MRIALGIEYDGNDFCGWQFQEGQRTVQGVLEDAISKVANHRIGHMSVAGRTDTGVHALEQVAHFDTDAERSMRSWVLGTNANLPHTVSVLWAKQVDDDFHARFKAMRRRYRYAIFSRWVRPTFLTGRAAWTLKQLDLGRMQAAARYLLGEHDFTSYRTVHCQAKSAVKTIYELEVSQQNDMFFIDIEANAFLHHMVRNIAGVLITIGAGEQEPAWAQEVLAHRDRTKGGVTAPAGGLYLTKVRYPEEFELPQLPPTSAIW